MNNERCDIEKEASKREFAKVIASLQEQSYRQKLAFENSIKAIKAAIEPVGCRDFCTAIYCKMITSKKKKNPRRTGK